MNTFTSIIVAMLLSIAVATISIGYGLSYINHYMYEHMDDFNTTVKGK